MGTLTEKGLFKLKESIEQAKTNISKIEGSQQTLLEQLQNDWGCSSIEEAEKKLGVIKKKIDRLSTQIKEGIEEIEEKYLTD